MPNSPEWLSKPENQEKMRQYRTKWRARNRETEREKQRERRENNRDEYNAYYREYYQKNKETRIPYLNAHRRNRVHIATPPWADKNAIRKFYIACPEGYHVDHIIPLRGEYVSGLHVIENLQYLPAIENIKKGNQFAVYEERP